MAHAWQFGNGWTPRGHVTPAVVGAVIEDLQATGDATASGYVAAVADATHPAHETLTWDDAEAGRARRLDEARTILRSMTYTAVYVGSKEPVPVVPTVVKMVHVPRLNGGEGYYVREDRLLTDQAAFDRALAEVRMRFESAWSSYRRLRRVSEGRVGSAPALAALEATFGEIDARLLSLR